MTLDSAESQTEAQQCDCSICTDSNRGVCGSQFAKFLKVKSGDA